MWNHFFVCRVLWGDVVRLMNLESFLCVQGAKG